MTIITIIFLSACHHYNSHFAQIDSIKWYKDGREFYRLHPGAATGYIRQFEVSSDHF